MYKIKLIIVLLFTAAGNVLFCQNMQGFLDSLALFRGVPNGITVYPIDFQSNKVFEAFLLDMNEAHFKAVKESGIWKPLNQVSKKYVKKNEYDITLSEVIKHSPQPSVSVVTVHLLDLKSAEDNEFQFTPLTSVNLLAVHDIFDIKTGKKIHSDVIHITPDVSKFSHRIEQNAEICRAFGQEIRNSLLKRFPVYNPVVALEKDDKNKATWIVVNNDYSEKTGKKGLYINRIVKSYSANDKTYYQIETIGFANFKQKYNPTTMLYGIDWGGKEIGQYAKRNPEIFVSTHSFQNM